MAILIQPAMILSSDNAVRLTCTRTGVSEETLVQSGEGLGRTLVGFAELADPDTQIGRNMQRMIATVMLQGGDTDNMGSWLNNAGEVARESLMQAATMRFESAGPARSWNERFPEAAISRNTFIF